MKQIDRIKEMEERYSRLSKALKKMEDALDLFTEAQEDAKVLNEYLGSDDWWSDVKADVDKKLPPELKRGVLSEDGIYNLLEDNRDLLDELADIKKE